MRDLLTMGAAPAGATRFSYDEPAENRNTRDRGNNQKERSEGKILESFRICNLGIVSGTPCGLAYSD
jgi:hypothetical protein